MIITDAAEIRNVKGRYRKIVPSKSMSNNVTMVGKSKERVIGGK